MDPLIGRVIADRYEIIQRIGSGGMGSVYRAKQASVARHVALKVLRPDLISNDHIRQRFHREADIIGRLSHPNTIRLFEFCTTEDGLAVMVMEMLEGQPLSERLKGDGPLGLLEGIQVGIEVARSLSEAHLLGLVHRDLKPANIFLHDVGGQQVTKVLDFGIARLMDEEATRLTVTDQVFGTPRYMSPEQGLSTANVDERSDIYSLGLILYECVVGQPPFVAQTSYQYLSAHSAERPPKLRASVPNAPAALEQLIDACLEKKAEDRPQTAQVVADQLEAIKRSVESGEPAPPPLALRRVPTAPTLSGGSTAVETSAPTVLAGGPDRRLLWGVAVLAGLVGLGLAVASRQGTDAVTTADIGIAVPDGGVAVAVAPPAPKPEPPVDPTEPDAAIEADPPPPTKKPTRKPTPKKTEKRKRSGNRKGTGKTQKRGGNDLVGHRTITGPRQITMPGFASEPEATEEDDLILKTAMNCKKSSVKGLSAITTVGCPSGCAILFDGLCAGQTPASKREVSPGEHKVTVVCKGKVRRSRTLDFAEKGVTNFRCR